MLFLLLIVFCAELEVCFGVVANGANLGGFFADYKVSAVTALPHSFLCLFEYLLHFNIGKKSTISFFVGFFNHSHLSELGCKLMEAFFIGLFCEGIVHIGPFIVFAFGCTEKVFSCISESA